MLVFQEIIDSIENLSMEDQDYLFELIQNRRIKNQRAKILINAQEVSQAFKNGTARRGSVEDLMSDLLREEDDRSSLE